MGGDDGVGGEVGVGSDGGLGEAEGLQTSTCLGLLGGVVGLEVRGNHTGEEGHLVMSLERKGGYYDVITKQKYIYIYFLKWEED